MSDASNDQNPTPIPTARPTEEPRLLPNPLYALHERAEAEFQSYERLEIVSTFGEPQAEYAALHKSCGLMDLSHRGVLELTGKDRLPFLNNLLTNETWFKSTKTGLSAGQGVYSFFLQTNGRIIADLNILERDDRTLVETDARLIEPVQVLLDRYLFSEQVKITSRIGQVHELALHGPGAPAVLDAAAGSHIVELPPLGSVETLIYDTPVTVWRDDVCGEPGLHLMVPAERVEHVWLSLLKQFGELVSHARRPLRPVGWAAFNTVRIEAGRPLFGIDFDSTVLPAETGEETFVRAVNVRKGCYVGQEIVARMYARKQSARSLVGLRLQGEALPIAGSPVYDDAGNQVGGITSSTISPIHSRAAVCFGFVKKPFVVEGKTVQVPAEGALAPATVSLKLKMFE